MISNHGGPAQKTGVGPRLQRPWPDALDEAGYHGPAGDIVRAIEPHSEADPTAILVQMLVAFGNACGRGAGFQVEADRHYTNLFVAIVGDTSKGRKGTSWGQARRPVALADRTDWASASVISGLSSGEGVIWEVRDEVFKQVPVKDEETKKVTGYTEEVADPGVSDKRRLIYESELASVLARMGREGNTLSPVVRQAWDGSRLSSLTKNSPAVATGAHISIVAHITEEELRRELTATEVANGFANRFLWVCSRRSKKLPHGGDLDSVDWTPLIDPIALALSFAQSVGAEPLPFDPNARQLWENAYDWLSEGAPGLFGAVTSRAEAQVRRLAVIYALLDCSAVIRTPHLRAALAIWSYCERSARYLFGDSLGDPLADQVRSALMRNPDGLTRTEINRLFGGHRQSKSIERALASLSERGLAACDIRSTGGRPEERWRAA